MNAKEKNKAPISEVTITRLLDAPRELVFQAFIDPKHLARWWGPHMFTAPVCKLDARPGGAIHVDMHGPGGMVHPMGGEYREIAKYDRIVMITRAFEEPKGVWGLEVEDTLTFADERGKTRLTLRAKVLKAKPEVYAALAGMEQGWSQSFEKLAELVGEGSRFVLTRTFDAPRDVVFAAWTEPVRLKEWMGPKGFTMLASKMELKPGGVYHYGMKSPDGKTMWGKWVFRDVAVPERLVFVSQFSDEKGGATRHPMAPKWPLYTLSTLIFTEKGGKTTLTMTGIPIEATAEEIETFKAGHSSMQGGWKGTLDALEAYLRK